MSAIRKSPNSLNLLSLLLIFAFLLSSCSPGVPEGQLTPTSSPTDYSQAVMGSGSYRAAHSMKELVEKSAIIVSGQFKSTKEEINMARDVNDINKPDPHILIVGQVYQFEVLQYLKGDGAKTIYVVQPEGFLAGDQVGITLDESKIKKARTLERYVSAKLENTYILFLEPLVGFPDLKDYYTGAIHPWRFDLSDPEQVIPESPWDGALGAFPATKMSIFLDKIANPDQDEGYPYPAPPEKP